ncbi:response regulator transcription factor [Phytomonospora endophytica]|uniref:Two-component system response regulator MprA n=1 Tax=Phytomonospora endophytica TaxID=714109 RepID=A0A841FA33_9ACTN|nr:response regulator transcription factor [Phytomonospora endophytica]MBB6032604.1 two-component system response regulator MprA [Phytomonospora endophytica]GIG66246.1 DNA-binding response regulator [Phytomonospora endophytica]
MTSAGTQRPTRVLVADDDPAVREVLVTALELAGHKVRAEPDGSRALAALGEWPPDVVVLDLLMPHADGLEVCRRLRTRGDRVPILMLTARDAVGDRVAGLDAGADDYLAKPFELDELLARVRALLRRAYPAAETRSHAGVTLDPSERRVWRDGEEIELTRTEFALLEILVANAGRVVTREVLTEQVWGFDFGPTSNSLDVYIGYVRRKLENGGRERVVRTVRGLGYRLGPG